MDRTPKNDSVVTLKSAEALKGIFEANRTFDLVELDEKVTTLAEAEGKIDSIEHDPTPDTVFTFRKNDTVYKLPYEAIDLEKFPGRIVN